jgi:hypothetical protein
MEPKKPAKPRGPGGAFIQKKLTRSSVAANLVVARKQNAEFRREKQELLDRLRWAEEKNAVLVKENEELNVSNLDVLVQVSQQSRDQILVYEKKNVDSQQVVSALRTRCKTGDLKIDCLECKLSEAKTEITQLKVTAAKQLNHFAYLSRVRLSQCGTLRANKLELQKKNRKISNLEWRLRDVRSRSSFSATENVALRAEKQACEAKLGVAEKSCTQLSELEVERDALLQRNRVVGIKLRVQGTVRKKLGRELSLVKRKNTLLSKTVVNKRSEISSQVGTLIQRRAAVAELKFDSKYLKRKAAALSGKRSTKVIPRVLPCKRQNRYYWVQKLSNFFDENGIHDDESIIKMFISFLKKKDIIGPKLRTKSVVVSDLLFAKSEKSAEGCLRVYLNALPFAVLHATIPPVFVRAVVSTFVGKLESHWDAMKTLQFKYENRISRAKLLRIRRLLGWEYVNEKWVPKYIDGVKIPQLSSSYAVNKLSAEIMSEYGMNVECEGLSASIDLRLSIGRYLKQQSSFVNALSLKHIRPAIQFMMDAANMFRGLKHCSIGFKFPNISNTPNSPFDTTIFHLFEGGDAYDSVVKLGASAIASMNDVISNPCVDGVVFSTFSGGDLASIGAMNRITGCNMAFPCPFCYTHKTNMCETDEDKIVLVQLRTCTDTDKYAHLVLGQCPGCKLEIVPPEFLGFKKSKHAYLAKKSENGVYERPFDSKGGVSYDELHKSVMFGRPRLLNLQPCQYVICWLHCKLRIISTFLHRFIITTWLTDARAEKVKSLFVKAGISVKDHLIKKQSKNLNIAVLERHSFIGRDAEKFMEIYPAVIDIVYPPDVTEFACVVYRERAFSVMGAWVGLKSYVECGSKWVDDSKRDYHATACQNLAKVFVREWVKNGASQGLYLHVLYTHLHSQLMLVGDLTAWQTQGLEHLHLHRKKDMHSGTNKKVGNQAMPRVAQALRSTSLRQLTMQINPLSQPKPTIITTITTTTTTTTMSMRTITHVTTNTTTTTTSTTTTMAALITCTTTTTTTTHVT